jgi:predicted metal-dependent peptidase
VFNFDTELDEASHMVWEKNKPKEWKRTRSGGTNFDCIAEFLFKNQNRWTGAIVYTDGFAAPMKHLNLKAKVMYLITHGGNIDQTTIKHTDHVVKM